jgi:hypothetical protein
MKQSPMKHRTLKIACLLLLFSTFALAQNVASFEKRITVKKLPNGLTLIICERPEAPVFSFFTLVDAGSAQDPMRATGLAHMFEHMAFKGTDKIGTTDYAAEKVALEKVEVAYAAYIAERDKSPSAAMTRSWHNSKKPGKTPSPQPTNSLSATPSASSSNRTAART